MSTSDDGNLINEKDYIIAMQICKKQEKNVIGIAILSNNNNNENKNNNKNYLIEAFDFIDNEQLTNLDSLLIKYNNSTIYISDELENNNNYKKINKQFNNLINNNENNNNFEINFIKKNLFNKNKTEINNNLIKLIGENNNYINIIETDHNLAYSSVGYLISSQNLSEECSISLRAGSLSRTLRLDSAASLAVHLLPGDKSGDKMTRENNSGDSSRFGSVYGVLNRCKTKMGMRLLDRWVRQPLLDINEINERLDIVQLFIEYTQIRLQLIDNSLRGVPDVDLLINKMTRKTANLGDAYRLYTFVKILINIENILIEFYKLLEYELNLNNNNNKSYKLNSLKLINEKFILPLHKLNSKFIMFQELIEHVIDFNKLPDFIVNAKHDPVLEELQEELDNTLNEIEKIMKIANSTWWNNNVQIEQGCGEIKLEKSNQYGYIFRTTKGDDERSLRNSNKNVKILQILKTGCYFTTPEMLILSDRYTDLEKEYHQKQQLLIQQCIDTALTYIPMVDIATNIVSELDVFLSFATVAALSPSIYSRPILYPLVNNDNEIRKINLINARHPCVELMDNISFIPNSYNLNTDNAMLQLVTGPNMGGKSTYIRGIGCIVIMAQVGSFIPCDDGSELTITDCILARVGAGDAVQKGVSTFMAEMLEASTILETATKNSLILIDELGRGTSTFDGYGLGWAICDYIVNNIKCLSLFATHFHELTALSETYPIIVNKHVSAIINDDQQVIMLYNVKDGPCTQSFGIHVAAMANFPNNVIQDAKRKAHQLENPHHHVLLDTNNEEYTIIQQKIQKFIHTSYDTIKTSKEALLHLKENFSSQ